MSSVRKQTNGAGSDYLLLLVLMPFVSAVLLLAGSGQSTQATEIGSPPPVVIQQQPTAMAATYEESTTEQPSKTAVPVVAAADIPDTNAEFLALYGEKNYPTLQSMPADMLSWYLTWVHRVAIAYDVPEEDILTVHFAELMGNGFNPLETRRSRSLAAGPGQIIPQTWNGWSCGSHQTVFMSDPAQIQACGGLGTDFDGNGIADVDTLPDNLAATAQHIKRDGVSKSLQSNASLHENILRDALSKYNSNKTYWQAPAITRTYVDIGLRWWRENAPLMAVYLSVYVQDE
ncbi:MAG: hypothetical protein K2Y39_06010 [Candidatus Obscuribacterales bacterium]|nr:hypothetical protein [Candidatus Obscuribacterales bacterium]